MDLFGTYRLLVYGQSDTNNALYLTYMNPGTGVTVPLSYAAIAPGSFASELRFVTPSTGFRGGIMVLRPAQTMTITFLCLEGDPIPPVPTPTGGPPIVIPIAECNDVNFYLQPPYTQTTTILSGTLYSDVNWAEYASMMTYNYAIYPLECTTLSIANWQVEAYNALMQFLDERLKPGVPGGNACSTTPTCEEQCGTGLLSFLCRITCGITDATGGFLSLARDILEWFWELSQILLLLFILIFHLFTMIIGFMLQLFGQAIGILSVLSASISSGDARTYTPPITCSGDSEAICMGLSILTVIDHYAGQYIAPIVYLGLAALSIFLVIYVVNQVRAMLQPGDSGGD